MGDYTPCLSFFMGFIISHLSGFLLSNQYNGMQECFFMAYFVCWFGLVGPFFWKNFQSSHPLDRRSQDCKTCNETNFFTSVGVNWSGLNMYCGPNLFITVRVTFK